MCFQLDTMLTVYHDHSIRHNMETKSNFKSARAHTLAQKAQSSAASLTTARL